MLRGRSRSRRPAVPVGANRAGAVPVRAVAVRTVSPLHGAIGRAEQVDRHALGTLVDASQECRVIPRPPHELGQKLLQARTIGLLRVELFQHQAEPLGDQAQDLPLLLDGRQGRVLTRLELASDVSQHLQNVACLHRHAALPDRGDRPAGRCEREPVKSAMRTRCGKKHDRCNGVWNPFLGVREMSARRPRGIRQSSAKRPRGVRGKVGRDQKSRSRSHRTAPRCGHGQKTDQVRRSPEGADPTEDVGPLRLVAVQASRGGSAHQQAHAGLDQDRDRGGSRRGGWRERAASITGRSAEDVVAGRSRREAGRGRALSKARRSESPQPLAPTDRWAARGGPCDASDPDASQGPEPAHHPPLAAAQTVASEQGAPAPTPAKRLTVEDLPPEARAQLDKLRKGLTDWDRRRHGT